MKIGFFGAAKTVTGSNYMIETTKGRLLVDCGMFQGGKELRDRNKMDFSYDPKTIDAVVITHGHIDHIGLLPKLVKYGFNGPIYATTSTHELMEVLLLDSAHIQESDIEWENKKRSRKGLDPLEPIYTKEDVDKTLKLIKNVNYHHEFVPVEGVFVNYKDAGHILGSGFIEVKITENGITKTFIFSGDIGRSNQKIIRDPETTSKNADYILIESTYGDRLHKTPVDTQVEIAEILAEISRTKGTLLIPAFALGRTQEMVYKFFELFDKHQIPDVKVFVDSPMATKVTAIYEKNKDLYDEESLEYLKNGKNPLLYKYLNFCETKEESMKLNDTPGPKVIISSSGMCDAGRILHHLKHNLWKNDTHVLFVGYQGEGTLGKMLIDGAKRVKIFGESIQVNAIIHTIGGLSAHADRDELVAWLKQFSTGAYKPKIFIVHGEPDSADSFSATIKSELGFDSIIPSWKQVVNIPFVSGKEEIERMGTVKEQAIIEKADEYERWKDLFYLVEKKMMEIENSDEKKKEMILKSINDFIEKMIT